jgi:hypothetical protein
VVISKAQAQVWFACPPCFVIAVSATDEELGSAVVAAAQSVQLSAGEASHEQTDAWVSEILATVGVKDWATLERNAKLANLLLDADGWEFKRMRRYRGGGWISLRSDEDRVVRLGSEAMVAEIGRTLRSVLDPPTMHAD